MEIIGISTDNDVSCWESLYSFDRVVYFPQARYSDPNQSGPAARFEQANIPPRILPLLAASASSLRR